MHYFPVAWPFLLAIALVLALVLLLIELRVIRYAYEKIGLSRRGAMLALLLSFFGSYVNIPIAEFPPETVRSDEVVDFAGVRYIVPQVESPCTILAVNVGGALVPTIVSIYLVLKHRLFWRGLLAVAIVAAVVHMLAEPVKGVGIAVPIFIPPLAAVAVALLVGWGHAPPLAWQSRHIGRGRHHEPGPNPRAWRPGRLHRRRRHFRRRLPERHPGRPPHPLQRNQEIGAALRSRTAKARNLERVRSLNQRARSAVITLCVMAGAGESVLADRQGRIAERNLAEPLWRGLPPFTVARCL
jgi:uncharacterized membrane protein